MSGDISNVYTVRGDQSKVATINSFHHLSPTLERFLPLSLYLDVLPPAAECLPFSVSSIADLLLTPVDMGVPVPPCFPENDLRRMVFFEKPVADIRIFIFFEFLAPV